MGTSKNGFSLSKVKLIPDGGLETHYTTLAVYGDEYYNNAYVVKRTEDIHPDLTKQFKAMKIIMAHLFGQRSILSLLEAPDFKASAKQKEQGEQFANEATANIEVRGISISGDDENKGVVLTGLFTFSNGLKAAINSPRIKLANTSFGFEEELEKIVATIEDEVYAYLFEGKKAQLELFE